MSQNFFEFTTKKVKKIKFKSTSLWVEKNLLDFKCSRSPKWLKKCSRTPKLLKNFFQFFSSNENILPPGDTRKLKLQSFESVLKTLLDGSNNLFSKKNFPDWLIFYPFRL